MPMATSRTRSEKHPPDWADFYKNGPPKEIIVIEDNSPPPPPQLSSSSASSSTSSSHSNHNSNQLVPNSYNNSSSGNSSGNSSTLGWPQYYLRQDSHHQCYYYHHQHFYSNNSNNYPQGLSPRPYAIPPPPISSYRHPDHPYYDQYHHPTYSMPEPAMERFPRRSNKRLPSTDLVPVGFNRSNPSVHSRPLPCHHDPHYYSHQQQQHYYHPPEHPDAVRASDAYCPYDSRSQRYRGSTSAAGPAMVDLIPLARKKRRPNADSEYFVPPAAPAPPLTPIAQETHPYYPHHHLTNDHGPGHDQDNCAPTIAPVPSRYTPVPIPRWDDKEGHYIVNPDDHLTSRYKILRQLGQGTFGKVVECYDSQTGKYCAIKVIRAVQKYRDASKIEIRVLNTLRRYDPRNSYKCLHLNEHFDFRNHVCMVFDLLGQSIYDWLKDNHFCPFPPNHLQHFARQLLTSVAFLHRLRLIHTDLKPENILLVNGDYKEVPYKNLNTTTRRVLLNPDIRLIDFGSATFQDEHHSSVVSTRHYRAPEIILSLGWSYPCDIWSIGCILVEFLTGEALFQTHDNLEHLAMMEVVLGRFPDRLMRASQKANQKYFVNDRLDYPNEETKCNSRKYVKALRPLEDYVMTKRNQNDSFEVAQELLDLLYRLLTYDPTDRITAAEALRHPYFDLILEETGRVVGYRDLLWHGPNGP